MKKKCNKCKTIKYLHDFPKDKCKKDGYKAFCKECHKKRTKERYKEAHQYIREYKLSKGCVICRYNKYADVLEFHHNGDKEFNISESNNLKRIKREMEKCIVLCANCHRELHVKQKYLKED